MGGGGTLSHQDLQNVIGTRSKGNNKLRTDMKPSVCVCVCECICESETHHHRLPTAILDRTRTASCCRALVLLGLLHSRGSAVCVGGLTPATGREGERSWEWSGLSPPPPPTWGETQRLFTGLIMSASAPVRVTAWPLPPPSISPPASTSTSSWVWDLDLHHQPSPGTPSWPPGAPRGSNVSSVSNETCSHRRNP